MANGLQYMHEHNRPSLVRRDIRTANILLASKFKAKIANFSVAKSTTNSLMLKMDVFSYGVCFVGIAFRKESNGNKREW